MRTRMAVGRCCCGPDDEMPYSVISTISNTSISGDVPFWDHTNLLGAFAQVANSRLWLWTTGFNVLWEGIYEVKTTVRPIGYTMADVVGARITLPAMQDVNSGTPPASKTLLAGKFLDPVTVDWLNAHPDPMSTWQLGHSHPATFPTMTDIDVSVPALATLEDGVDGFGYWISARVAFRMLQPFPDFVSGFEHIWGLGWNPADAPPQVNHHIRLTI